jgi:putative ABC transport system permease protein
MDSVFLCGIAFVLTLGISEFLLPFFNDLAGKVVSKTVLGHFSYVGLMFLIALITGLLSGIYPAVFLSSYDPIKGLKGEFSSGNQSTFIRKGLVVSQFIISIVLIVATIVVYSQLDFMQNKQLGFKKDNKLVIDFHYDNRITGRFKTITDEFMKLPGVSMAGISSAIPGKENRKFATAIKNSQNEMQDFQSDGYFVDYNFLKQYDLKLIGGRMFSSAFPTDLRTAMIINEAAMKSLGYTDPKNVVGKEFTQATAGGKGQVIGVIKDFHYHSSQEAVRPLTLRIAPGFLTFLTVDLNTTNVKSTIAVIEKKWKQLAPGMPMSYSFMDDVYNEQYQSEERFGKLFICFSVFAIFISCLGLYGLSAFSTVQRKKEIGIRKVLGASVSGITTLLSADLLKLVIIAFMIASPVAWWLSEQWLMDFAYRINVSWWMFVLAGMVSVIIAFVSVAFLALRAAVGNPVKSLRSE